MNSARVAGFRAIVILRWSFSDHTLPIASSILRNQTRRGRACRPRLSRSRMRLEVLEVRGGQFTALAHDVEAELLPLVEVAHSGALDRGNMHEYVFSAIAWLNEAKALLRIEKLDCTLSHIWPPVKRRSASMSGTTSCSLASEFNGVLGKALTG